jgi:hypothetical protein
VTIVDPRKVIFSERSSAKKPSKFHLREIEDLRVSPAITKYFIQLIFTTGQEGRRKAKGFGRETARSPKQVPSHRGTTSGRPEELKI